MVTEAAMMATLANITATPSRHVRTPTPEPQPPTEAELELAALLEDQLVPILDPYPRPNPIQTKTGWTCSDPRCLDTQIFRSEGAAGIHIAVVHSVPKTVGRPLKDILSVKPLTEKDRILLLDVVARSEGRIQERKDAAEAVERARRKRIRDLALAYEQLHVPMEEEYPRPEKVDLARGFYGCSDPRCSELKYRSEASVGVHISSGHYTPVTTGRPLWDLIGIRPLMEKERVALLELMERSKLRAEECKELKEIADVLEKENVRRVDYIPYRNLTQYLRNGRSMP
ncbi:hypothetical protein BJ508DRAFT_378385 [Ascobolus immersus RN42]|uniref:Uncharacterized protein n=1 Tax=Ascobolus immersus RN42 TaxID=1160509 RepID=A0A3N4HYM1_ASCIM|nr:hypothetical protein BJ508DRAFT_378385 [Ascobolus immersus RN42]